MARRGVAAVSLLLVGCYTLQPTRGAVPQPGTIIGLDITDAGRVALGGSMGPEIGQVEGRLVDKDSSAYVVAVSAIHLLRGGEQVWTGENVRINTSYVSSVYERRLSVGRSVALAAVGVGAVAAIATRSLAGLGTGDTGKGPDSSGTTQRRPRP